MTSSKIRVSKQTGVKTILSYVIADKVALNISDSIEHMYFDLFLQMMEEDEKNGRREEKWKKRRKSFVRSRR